MEAVAVNKEIDKIDPGVYNYSDDELIFKELCKKFYSLKTQHLKTLQERKDVAVLIDRNESIIKSLLKVKTDYDLYETNLNKTLYTLKLTTDKQKILSRKKLEELYSKQKKFEDYYKFSPCKLELDELTKENRSLEQELKRKNDLFNLTQRQYIELKHLIIETLKKKVCEFCDIVLQLQTQQLGLSCS